MALTLRSRLRVGCVMSQPFYHGVRGCRTVSLAGVDCRLRCHSRQAGCVPFACRTGRQQAGPSPVCSAHSGPEGCFAAPNVLQAFRLLDAGAPRTAGHHDLVTVGRRRRNQPRPLLGRRGLGAGLGSFGGMLGGRLRHSVATARAQGEPESCYVGQSQYASHDIEYSARRRKRTQHWDCNFNSRFKPVGPPGLCPRVGCRAYARPIEQPMALLTTTAAGRGFRARRRLRAAFRPLGNTATFRARRGR